jgi:hypothetical protein
VETVWHSRRDFLAIAATVSRIELVSMLPEHRPGKPVPDSIEVKKVIYWK